LYSGKNAKGVWRLIVTNKDGRIDFGERVGTDQPATAEESKAEGEERKEKAKPESEGCSR